MKHRTMKKAWILLLALLLLSALPACGTPADEGADSARPENEPARQEDACTAYSAQDVTFQVPADWTQAEGTNLFYAAGRREVYGLNGASPPGILHAPGVLRGADRPL